MKQKNHFYHLQKNWRDFISGRKKYLFRVFPSSAKILMSTDAKNPNPGLYTKKSKPLKNKSRNIGVEEISPEKIHFVCLICTHMYTHFREMDLFYEMLNFVLFPKKKCVMYFKQISYDIISPHRYDTNCFLQNICCVIIMVRHFFF